MLPLVALFPFGLVPTVIKKYFFHHWDSEFRRRGHFLFPVPPYLTVCVYLFLFLRRDKMAIVTSRLKLRYVFFFSVVINVFLCFPLGWKRKYFTGGHYWCLLDCGPPLTIRLHRIERNMLFIFIQFSIQSFAFYRFRALIVYLWGSFSIY